MSILDSIFGGGGKKDPVKEANQFLNQIPGVGHAGYDPYITKGLNAGDITDTQYQNLINDPAGFINKLMESYSPSTGFNFQKDLLNKELGNTAAAGGIAGTPLDQLNRGEAIQGLLSKDMQQFLANVLGVYGQGLTGEEGIATRGFNASKDLTDLLVGALNQQGGLAFQNAQQQNQNKNDLWSMFGKTLGAGVGGYLGGVPGAAVGSSIGGR